MSAAGEPKLHLYWRLTEPARGANLDRVRKVREIAARKVGSDASVARLQQPIRLAGSVHGKYGRRAPARILEATDRVCLLAELECAVHAMPPIAPDNAPEADAEPERVPSAGPIRSGGVDGITRFDAMTQFIGKQVRRMRLGQVTRAEAWQTVVAFNAKRIEPSWDEARLHREFDALVLVDQRNHRTANRVLSNDFDRTEHGLARLLADERAELLRYVSGLGGWLFWTGSSWRLDDTGQILELCRELCERAAEGQAFADRRRLLSDRTIRAVERLARSDRRLASEISDWDADSMLLNTPASVVDLRTGELRPHDPAFLMTHITNASPDVGCPLWLRFIDRITSGDAELAAYLQRVAGYCLTGLTREQVFFFIHGAGANGKTVFLEVLADTVGSYARTAPLDSFMAARADRHPADLAGLDGARIAIATETEPGRTWAESRIKQITGGDRLAVRRMYGDFYQTTPTYKLLVAGNHRPRLLGGGPAMARRLQLIPFETVIPEGERDRSLRERLGRERDGILGWMLEGCRSWQAVGLLPPQRIRDAVSSYFEGEDFSGHWIADCCETGEHLSASNAELYASWKAFAEPLGIEPGSVRDLGEKLRDRGFSSFRNRRTRGWRGLRPLPSEPGDDAGNPR
jgi:P4 family phage/plasmid primase-like protien